MVSSSDQAFGLRSAWGIGGDMAGFALVTGASAGIGRELARQLVRDRGDTVIVTARRLDRLESLAVEFPGGRILPIPGDLADPGFRSELVARAESASHPNGLDILINNAGLGRYDFFPDQDLAAIRRIMEVNVLALCDLTRLVLPGMIRRGRGQVVQVSSVLGELGVPYSAVYTASKHAVHGLVKCLRHELHGTGVRVWAACPAQTESEFREVASGGPRVGRRGEPTDKVARGSCAVWIGAGRSFIRPPGPRWWPGSPIGCPARSSGSSDVGRGITSDAST